MSLTGAEAGVIADQLEERGLIERRPPPTDRRIKSRVVELDEARAEGTAVP